MSPEDQQPQPAPNFPNYPKPGLDLAHPKQVSPLTKMMKMLLKPKVRIKSPPRARTNKTKKLTPYY